MPSRKSVTRRRRTFRPSTGRKHWLVATVVVLVAGLAVVDRLVLVHGEHAGHDDWRCYDQKAFAVLRVVDGDTMDLDVLDGLRSRSYTRVRLWGIDSPEGPRNGRPGMYYGDQATDRVAKLVLNNQVQLRLHPGKETRGKYGRLLAYIHLPETDQVLNELLVQSGHAYADLRFDHIHMSHYKWLEKQAREQGRGLWAAVQREQWPEWRRRMVTDGP
jgi:endonuclease YncB( thermonuclease family)